MFAKKFLTRFALIMGVFSSLSFSAKAGSFVNGQGVYDFTVELNGVLKDDGNGRSNKLFGYEIEVNNEFGITENQLIAIDFILGKNENLDQSGRDFKTPLEKLAKIRHRINFEASKSINFGLENGLAFTEGDTSYDPSWEIKGMMGHDARGFYQYSRAEITYTRQFKGDSANSLLLDLRAKFRITNAINFLLRTNASMLFASQNYIDNNSQAVSNGRINSHSLKTFKVAEWKAYAGPEFTMPNGDALYVYYTMQLDASEAKRNHFKGLILGYSKSIDLKK